MGQKLEGLRPLFGDGGAGSPSKTKSPGPRPTSITSGVLIYEPFGRNGYKPKIGAGAVPLWGRGSWVPI